MASFSLSYHPKNGTQILLPIIIQPPLTQPMDPEKKSLNFIFPTKYAIPKSLKFSHWPSKPLAKFWRCFFFPPPKLQGPCTAGNLLFAFKHGYLRRVWGRITHLKCLCLWNFRVYCNKKSSSFPSHSCLCLIACLFLCLFFWLMAVCSFAFISYRKWSSLAHLLITKHHPVVDLYFCLPSHNYHFFLFVLGRPGNILRHELGILHGALL